MSHIFIKMDIINFVWTRLAPNCYIGKVDIKYCFFLSGFSFTWHSRLAERLTYPPLNPSLSYETIAHTRKFFACFSNMFCLICLVKLNNSLCFVVHQEKKLFGPNESLNTSGLLWIPNQWLFHWWSWSKPNIFFETKKCLKVLGKELLGILVAFRQLNLVHYIAVM